MKKPLLISALLVVLGIFGIAGVRAWRTHVVANLEARAFAQATKLLRDGRGAEALAICDDQQRTDLKFNWSSLQLHALVEAGQIARLGSLYSRFPARVLTDESASLYVARAYFAARQLPEFNKIREAWMGREVRQELWLALDSDVLGLEGKVQEAEKLLRTKQFKGEAEATRLVRLALHAAQRNQFEAWTLLDQAYVAAPRNTEIRSFRGQILESIGRVEEARVEYVAAHVAAPANPLLRDELAEFYRRQGNYDLALDTWREALKFSPPDFVALKEAFWSRMVQPGKGYQGKSPTTGALGPLVDFIRALPEGHFWDSVAFAGMANNDRYARERQEVFWLQLLELLRIGREKEAQDLLASDRKQARSWRPDAESALDQLLHVRTKHLLPAGLVVAGSLAPETHPFLRELAQYAVVNPKSGPTPPALTAFAQSRNAFAGVLLAVGWREAALRLSHPSEGAETPAWFSYGLTQCLRFNRGNEAALEYVSHQPRSPELTLLHGELLLAAKQPIEGFKELQTIATLDSDAGYRAAWLLAQSAIDAHEFGRAHQILQGQPKLSDSITGREMKARIYLLQGDQANAEKLYGAIAKDSNEALAYLARRAYDRKDWKAAREQTETLRKRLPDELQLRENLILISKAEKTNASK